MPGLKIVPNADGFGVYTRAAYGGAISPIIVRVINLNDSGPGSLRDAIALTVPRVIIFETSGTIELFSDLVINDPYLTIAGQTAPSPGITLRGYGIWIYSHDILIQHLRVRVGDTGATNDGQGIRAGVYQDGAFNLMFDHLSVSWTNDEGTIVAKTFAGNPGTSDANVSFWRCLVAEGLYNTVREPGIEGKGLAVNYHSRNVSAIQNAYISTANRLPLVKGGTSVYFVNNFIYNWWLNPPATFIDPVEDGIQNGPFFTSVIGNHYRTGPSWDPSGAYVFGSRYAQTGSQLYLSDNIRDAVGGVLNEFLVVGPDGIDPRVGSAPVTLSGHTPLASSSIQALVLANAGARPLDRDSVDTRLVNDATNRTGASTLHSQNDVGGWPSLAVNIRALTTPNNPNTVTGSGYTNLELWLQGYASALEPGGSTPPPITTYYVSTSGNNANAGTLAAPWRTIDFAKSQMHPGDTLQVRGGTYVENLISGMPNGTDWTVGSGAIYVTAYQNELVWLRPASGSNAVLFDNVIYHIWQGINVDGINLTDTNNPAIRMQGTSHHIRWTGLSSSVPAIIQNSYQSGISPNMGSACTNIDLLKLVIANGGRNSAEAHGIHLEGTNNVDAQILIREVEVYGFPAINGNNGFHAYSQDPANRIVGVTIDRCKSHHNNYGSILANSHGGITITNSMFYSNVVDGLILFDDIDSCTFYNNLFDSNGGYGTNIGTAGASLNCIFKNNAFTNNTLGSIIVQTVSPTTKATFDTNGINGNGVNAVNDSNGLSTVTGTISGAPLYTNVALADYRSAAGSPYLDAGLTLASVTTDILGTTRPQGSAYDIGPYEGAAGTIPPPPPQSTGNMFFVL